MNKHTHTHMHACVRAHTHTHTHLFNLQSNNICNFEGLQEVLTFFILSYQKRGNSAANTTTNKGNLIIHVFRFTIKHALTVQSNTHTHLIIFVL